MVGMSSASGAVVGHHNGKTYILTARHFCDEEGKGYLDVINAHTQKGNNRYETTVHAKESKRWMRVYWSLHKLPDTKPILLAQILSLGYR